MSKADELFVKLGYRKAEYHLPTAGTIIEYYDNVFELSPIDFIFRTKEIRIWHSNIGMQQLQAINEKVKELRLV